MLLCALAFNLTFFWQELWLVLPKALTPGLHPILYHNNHAWTGEAPIAELLPGSGALATLVSGLAFRFALSAARRASATWRLFFFWMAFQGLYQCLLQFAIGALLPGNDVGRALGYLGVGMAGKMVLLALAVTALAFVGGWLARAYPDGTGEGRRRFGYTVLLAALLSVALIIPFRIPRNIVEVALIPLVVNLVGIGWLVLGAAFVRPNDNRPDRIKPAVAGPALALGATLLLFQWVLRPGIAF